MKQVTINPRAHNSKFHPGTKYTHPHGTAVVIKQKERIQKYTFALHSGKMIATSYKWTINAAMPIIPSTAIVQAITNTVN
jgi:hypothetical protein